MGGRERKGGGVEEEEVREGAEGVAGVARVERVGCGEV